MSLPVCGWLPDRVVKLLRYGSCFDGVVGAIVFGVSVLEKSRATLPDFHGEREKSAKERKGAGINTMYPRRQRCVIEI